MRKRKGLLLTQKKPQQPKNIKQDFPRIITRFGSQWTEVQRIPDRHWHILRSAPLITNLVSPRPLLTARRACNLGDVLVHSEYIRTTSESWLIRSKPPPGMHACEHCSICRYVHQTDVFANPCGGKNYNIKQFINCSTTQVIYMLTCPCNQIYIGKTKRQLRIRIGEHIGSIKKKDDDRPIPLHFARLYNGDPKGLMVQGIYVLNLPPRRGGFDTILLQKEKMWTYYLDSMVPKGLNTECSLQPFLEK